jgi:hypothetical protein
MVDVALRGVDAKKPYEPEASLLLFIKIDRIQSFDIRFFKVSFPIRLDARAQRRHSYETTPKWHDFLMITLAALAAGLNSEPQNIE